MHGVARPMGAHPSSGVRGIAYRVARLIAARVSVARGVDATMVRTHGCVHDEADGGKVPAITAPTVFRSNRVPRRVISLPRLEVTFPIRLSTIA